MKKILILLFLMLLPCAFAQSYRWRNMPIKVYISETHPKTPLMKRAFSEWQIKSRGLVRFQYLNANDINNADIIVIFTDRGHKGENEETEAIGTAAYRHLWSDGYFHKVRIEINDKKWKTTKLTTAETYEVMLHEIGHAIGLYEHSKNPESLMYPTASQTGTHRVSEEELQRLRNLYKN